MLKRLSLLLILLITACQPSAPSNTQATLIPFPTVTTGRSMQGALPTLGGESNVPNPATAAALANQPTATPNWSACPTPAEVSLGEFPSTGREALDAIVRFLSEGGTANDLEDALRDDWNVLGESGIVNNDIDFTGEGEPEILVTYTAPDNLGNLLILSCANNTYSSRYQAIGTSATPPEVASTTDVNFDTRPDVLFANHDCDEDDVCVYQTQLVTWQPELGRFASLLTGSIESDALPELRDVDNDQVSEIVLRMEDDGNAATGPLRTGLNIYDWNGAGYRLSIIQLDPPRFTIQIVHEADRALAQRDMTKAIALYETALNDTNLQAWFNDDPQFLSNYIQYRLILAYGDTGDSRGLDLYTLMMEANPDPATRPVYVTMSDTFWNAFQVTNNLHDACLEVLDIVAQQPDALTLMNRYGSRSPTYTANDLCPF